jgi:hypothetical protein
MENIEARINRDVVNFIHTGMDKILKENTQFDVERNIQYELARELRNLFNRPDIDNKYVVYLEYDEKNFALNSNMENVKDSWVIDIVIEFNKKYYVVELKYGYDVNGTGGRTNLSQAVKGFDEDISKVQKLVNKYKNIDCGYCILITAEKQYVKNYTTNNKKEPLQIDWKDFNWWPKAEKTSLSYYIEEIKKK